jgi:hypothetical protein
MQSLLARIGAPAGSAAGAGALFTWQGDTATPAGALAGGLAALHDARSRIAADTQQRTAASAASSVPGATASAAALNVNDPKAIEELQKKMEKMTDQERVAFAMQLNQQMAQAAMGPSGPGLTDAQEAMVTKVDDALQAVAERRTPGIVPFQRAIAGLDPLKAQWAQAHANIDRQRGAEVQAVPLLHAGEVGGCYSSANAARVRQIELKYADAHVAEATRQLAQGAEWASTVSGELAQVAREDDGLSAAFAAADQALPTTWAGRNQAALNVLGVHDQTLAIYVQPYADGVTAIDREAASWVHAKAALAALPLAACR